MNTMRIAIVEDEEKDMLQLTGVLNAYAENHGLTFAIDTFSSGEAFLRAFAPKKYTAVSVMSDVSACGIITGLARAGVRVPEDISVVGFDNLSMSKMMVPRLTTISQNIEWKARRAGDLLFEMITTGASLTVCEQLSPELEDRDTVKNIVV